MKAQSETSDNPTHAKAIVTLILGFIAFLASTAIIMTCLADLIAGNTLRALIVYGVATITLNAGMAALSAMFMSMKATRQPWPIVIQGLMMITFEVPMYYYASQLYVLDTVVQICIVALALYLIVALFAWMFFRGDAPVLDLGEVQPPKEVAK